MSSAVQTLTQIKRPVLWQLMCTAAPDIARFISQLEYQMNDYLFSLRSGQFTPPVVNVLYTVFTLSLRRTNETVKTEKGQGRGTLEYWICMPFVL